MRRLGPAKAFHRSIPLGGARRAVLALFLRHLVVIGRAWHIKSCRQTKLRRCAGLPQAVQEWASLLRRGLAVLPICTRGAEFSLAPGVCIATGARPPSRTWPGWSPRRSIIAASTNPGWTEASTRLRRQSAPLVPRAPGPSTGNGGSRPQSSQAPQGPRRGQFRTVLTQRRATG